MKTEHPEDWRKKCEDCEISDSCFLKQCASYCSGVIDVGPLLAIMRDEYTEAEKSYEDLLVKMRATKLTFSEECIICGKSGGLYVTCGPFKTGPYCSDHRWELSVYVGEKKRRMAESKFNDWVDEFQNKERREER